MLRSYALSPDTLRRILRKVFWRFQIIVTLSFLAFGLFLSASGRPVNWSSVLPMIGMIALVYFFIIYFNYRQQIKWLYSIRYELDGSSLIYRQIGQPPLRIMRPDITRVYERKDGFFVETLQPGAGLLVMRGLARTGDEDIRTTLETWVGITAAEKQARHVSGKLVGVGVIAAVLILLFANSLWVLAAIGLLLLALGMLAERQFTRQQHTLPGTMQMYSIAIAFLLFVILMKSCLLATTFMIPQ